MTTEARTRGPSKNDLLIAILSQKTFDERLAEVQKLGPSKSVVRRAAFEMRTNNAVIEALEAYADEHGYTAFARRGRFAPQAGETRVYNVQCVKEDATFIRLPLSSLPVGKGSKVRVDFENNEIVVRAGTSSTTHGTAAS